MLFKSAFYSLVTIDKSINELDSYNIILFSKSIEKHIDKGNGKEAQQTRTELIISAKSCSASYGLLA